MEREEVVEEEEQSSPRWLRKAFYKYKLLSLDIWKESLWLFVRGWAESTWCICPLQLKHKMCKILPCSGQILDRRALIRSPYLSQFYQWTIVHWPGGQMRITRIVPLVWTLHIYQYKNKKCQVLDMGPLKLALNDSNNLVEKRFWTTQWSVLRNFCFLVRVFRVFRISLSPVHMFDRSTIFWRFWSTYKCWINFSFKTRF